VGASLWALSICGIRGVAERVQSERYAESTSTAGYREVMMLYAQVEVGNKELRPLSPGRQ
jgi:hypothetical protein